MGESLGHTGDMIEDTLEPARRETRYKGKKHVPVYANIFTAAVPKPILKYRLNTKQNNFGVNQFRCVNKDPFQARKRGPDVDTQVKLLGYNPEPEYSE